MEKTKFILKKIKVFLVIFIGINIIAFSTIVIQNIKQLYPKEKIMMQSAALITVVYIIPISKVFGNHNIFTLPFYMVRNKLYYTAYKMYPKYEAEKEIQWYAIRGIEYRTLYHPLVEEARTNPKKLANNKEMWQWTDEFYNNSMLLANEKTEQPFFNKYIYRNYIGEMSQYLDDRPLLFLSRDNYNFKNLLSDSEEISRFNNIFITSEKLKKNFQKNNIDSLNYFLVNPNIYPQEFLNKHEILVYLLSNKIMDNKLSCKDGQIADYINNRNVMLKYLKNPPAETIRTTNIETTYSDLYKWQLNKDLEKTIKTQCKIRLE